MDGHNEVIIGRRCCASATTPEIPHLGEVIFQNKNAIANAKLTNRIVRFSCYGHLFERQFEIETFA